MQIVSACSHQICEAAAVYFEICDSKPNFSAQDERNLFRYFCLLILKLAEFFFNKQLYSSVKVLKSNNYNSHYDYEHLLYFVLVRTEQFSEQCSRTMRGPNRLGQHSSLMQVFLQKSATRSAVRTISTVAR